MKPRMWMLSYDISDARRLRRVAELALRHGERVQKSLYLCALSYDQLGQVHAGLSAIVDANMDRVMLRPICRRCREQTRYQGAGANPEHREPFWIV